MNSYAKLIPSGRKLMIFEAAARTGSFSAAAREFNLTQPSVSRSIAEFEQSLGITLFHRHATGLELTEEGKELNLIVGESLSKIERGIQSILDRRRQTRPVVSLSFSTSFVMHWLVPRLSRFQSVFPDIDLRFDLIAGVLRQMPDNIDLVSRIVNDQDQRYDWWHLAPEIIVPVCSPAYIARAGRLTGDGTGHVFLNLTDHSSDEWRGVFGSRGPHGATKGAWLQFSDYGVALQAAMNGEGIALGWISVAAKALITGQLVPASDRWIDTGRKHQLVRLKTLSPRPTVISIAEWLAAEMQRDRLELIDVFPELAAVWIQ